MNQRQLTQLERLDLIEDQARRALVVLSKMRGRASVDDQGIGAVRFLLEQQLLQRWCAELRAAITWPVECQCGFVYDEEEWSKLAVCGDQDDGAGGVIELRHCTDCASTLGVPVARRRAA